eukprot:GILK01002891.1.p1 GENE.GILK01002891.1~~GILK01002891.1.p1  ORF type:complete len:254 (-),score=62.97 GILK01002891.1:534-1295(-)
MSSAVLGKRTAEDSYHQSIKRLRCSSVPRLVNQPAESPEDLLENLRQLFPAVEPRLLEIALQQCQFNLEATIQQLQQQQQQAAVDAAEKEAQRQRELQDVHPLLGPSRAVEWAEITVRELSGAMDLEDAKTRAVRVTAEMERQQRAAVDEYAQRAQAETAVLVSQTQALSEQLQNVSKENSILKKAVLIQTQRNQTVKEKEQEIEHLRGVVQQYEEQMRKMEMNQYALALQLRSHTQSHSQAHDSFGRNNDVY